MKFSTQLLKAAWQIFKATVTTWGNALKSAFANLNIKDALKNLKAGQVAHLIYKKLDGTVKVTFAIPFPKDFTTTGTGKQTPSGNAMYFDPLAGVGGAVRSFVISNLISFKIKNA